MYYMYHQDPDSPACLPQPIRILMPACLPARPSLPDGCRRRWGDLAPKNHDFRVERLWKTGVTGIHAALRLVDWF